MSSESEESETYDSGDKIIEETQEQTNEDQKQDSKKRKYEHKKENGSDEKETKIFRRELYKAPTVEELNQLRETEILFNSNLFRLQTDELLKEVAVKQKRKREIGTWLEKFETFLNNLPEHTDQKFSDFEACVGTLNTPKLKGVLKQIAKNKPNTLKSDQDASIKFLKPCSVNTVGLYKINATIGPVLNIMLNVVMPKACFNEKDYLNGRYAVKRGLYLSYIASYLKNANMTNKICYTHLNGNNLIPILQVTSENVKNTTFKILLTPEENIFKLSRFDPDKSNLRASYFNSLLDQNITETDNSVTPFYNSVVLNDLTLAVNDRFRQNLITDMKGATDGLILLTIWLRQRELIDGYGGFNDELLYSLVAYLANVNKINKHMSSYQVIRNVWTYLLQSTWDTEGVTMADDKINLPVFHAHYDTVFVDRTGHYNLTSNLSLNVYLKVKYEAGLAINYLDESKMNSFQALFMTSMPFYIQYDAVINIFNNKSGFDKVYNEVEDKNKLDTLGYKYPMVVKSILEGLKIGLNDRVLYIVPKLQCSEIWNIGTQYVENKMAVSVGLHLDFANMFNIVDKGPLAYDSLAAQFRKFWGEKAELRRFKDGSICEAVFWPTSNVNDKRKISKLIVEYVLESKFNIKNYNIIYDQFDPILEIYKAPAIEEGNMKVIHLFDEVAKMLRELNLPLSISAVQGTCDAFCHTDAFPPTPMNYRSGKKVTFETDNNILFKGDIDLKVAPKYIVPVEGIIQMVHHSKWPNNIEAMSKLRTAFYIQISEMLKKNSHIKCNPKEEHLDILYKGLVFRFVLFHPKQIPLLKKHMDTKGIVSFRDTEDSVVAEQNYVVLPKVVGALSGIHSQYPSYGPGTALIKRWLNSQLIDESHISNTVVNLLNASLYLNSAPYSQCILPQMAFLRFLKLLVQHDWNMQMLVVNFNNEITKEQIDVAESDFQKNREEYPALYIITPYDFKSLLTQNAPSKQIMQRISILAKQCITVIETNIYSESLFNVMSFFKPNLTGYNVVIHLQPLLNPRRHEAIISDFESKLLPKYEENKEDRIPIVKFNPVDLYLRDLRRHYDNFALFFHDSYGGDVIAVLWKPTVCQQTDFKISEVEGKKLVSKEKLQVNINSIIEDFYILGTGVIKSIEKM
ncbi:Maternal transcript 89Ba [Carabus blaptoides fortunei]